MRLWSRMVDGVGRLCGRTVEGVYVVVVWFVVAGQVVVVVVVVGVVVVVVVVVGVVVVVVVVVGRVVVVVVVVARVVVVVLGVFWWYDFSASEEAKVVLRYAFFFEFYMLLAAAGGRVWARLGFSFSKLGEAEYDKISSCPSTPLGCGES